MAGRARRILVDREQCGLDFALMGVVHVIDGPPRLVNQPFVIRNAGAQRARVAGGAGAVLPPVLHRQPGLHHRAKLAAVSAVTAVTAPGAAAAPAAQTLRGRKCDGRGQRRFSDVVGLTLKVEECVSDVYDVSVTWRGSP